MREMGVNKLLKYATTLLTGLEDPELTLPEKGLLAVMSVNPGGVKMRDLVETSLSSISEIKRVSKALESKGYITLSEPEKKPDLKVVE